MLDTNVRTLYCAYMARETTVNIRASHAEKQVWQQAALQAGFQHHENGKPVGSISKWLRSLADANTAGGKA